MSIIDLIDFPMGIAIGMLVASKFGYRRGLKVGMKKGIELGLDLWHKWHPMTEDQRLDMIEEEERN